MGKGTHTTKDGRTVKKGLYYNINKKKAEGKKSRPKGAKGAPSAKDFKDAAKTAKKKDGGLYTMAEGGMFHRGCGAVMPDRKKKTKYF
jgi:hypothetical protein